MGVWVQSGGLPCGARQLGEAGNGRVWLDVCVLGQHLPQQYRPAEISDLDAGGCAGLGLCPACLGFGDLDPALPRGLGEAARGVDQITRPCGTCGGSGRPALRVQVTRTANGVTGQINPVAHDYVPPLPGMDLSQAVMFGLEADSCLACGTPPDGSWPTGEVLHPAAGA